MSTSKFGRFVRSPEASLSAFAVLLTAARVAATGHTMFLFMLWNLAIAALACRCRQRPLLAWAFGLLWLGFFPNAPYLLSDLIHLDKDRAAPLWYDLILLLAYAAAGLALAWRSLAAMKALFHRRLSRLAGWLPAAFAWAVWYLAAFGIYLGRFRRWNTWDVIGNFGGLCGDIASRLGDPLGHPGCWGFTLIGGSLLGLLWRARSGWRGSVGAARTGVSDLAEHGAAGFLGMGHRLGPVLAVNQHHGRLEGRGILGRHRSVSADDHQVAGLHQAGSGAVQADVALVAYDHVGGEAVAGVDVVDVHLLPGQKARGLDQIGADGDRAFIVEDGSGHPGAMDLAFQEGHGHGFCSWLRFMAK
jgi:uncharacterized membrane protein